MVLTGGGAAAGDSPVHLTRTPAAVQPSERGCVTAVRGVYGPGMVAAALPGGEDDPRAQPDVVLLHNADLYMPVWRRSLAYVLTARALGPDRQRPAF